MSDRNWDDTLLAITQWTAIVVAVVAILVVVLALLLRFFP